jgi:hypothetical protein
MTTRPAYSITGSLGFLSREQPKISTNQGSWVVNAAIRYDVMSMLHADDSVWWKPHGWKKQFLMHERLYVAQRRPLYSTL